jgi:hypothetical protein
MPTLTAEAALTTSFTFTPVIGFRPYAQGLLDPQTGSIKPTGSSRWSQLTGRTWSTWNNFQLSQNQIRWTSNLIDVGEIKYFNININSDFDGSLYYIVHVSETGAFQGEESEYLIQDGDLNVDAFYGRYVYVTAFVTGKEFRSMVITTSSEPTLITLTNIDTSTLTGSTSNRQLSITQPISAIVDLQIQPRAATTYNVNLYVSDTATSKVLIPVVLSKTLPTPQIVMYGIDNDARDGIVDITIKALPRQAMTGGNLVVFN